MQWCFLHHTPQRPPRKFGDPTGVRETTFLAGGESGRSSNHRQEREWWEGTRCQRAALSTGRPPGISVDPGKRAPQGRVASWRWCVQYMSRSSHPQETRPSWLICERQVERVVIFEAVEARRVKFGMEKFEAASVHTSKEAWFVNVPLCFRGAARARHGSIMHRSSIKRGIPRLLCRVNMAQAARDRLLSTKALHFLIHS